MPPVQIAPVQHWNPRTVSRTLAIAAIAFVAGCAGSDAAFGGSGQSGTLNVDPALLRPAGAPPQADPTPPQADAAPPQAAVVAPPPEAAAAEPALDIEALKQRLSDTGAIGVFTKLALKNQMDDLLDRFRAHYAQQPASDVAVLREPYNMLVMKVLALLQDGDPSLARTIARSREALWIILADRQKFALIG